MARLQTFLISHMLFLSAFLTFRALIACVVELGFKVYERFDGDAFYLFGRGGEAHDCAASNNGRAEFFDKRDGLFYGVAAAYYVVNDDAGVDLAWGDVLAKSASASLLLGPVNLLCVQSFAHAEGYGDAA